MFACLVFYSTSKTDRNSNKLIPDAVKKKKSSADTQ